MLYIYEPASIQFDRNILNQLKNNKILNHISEECEKKSRNYENKSIKFTLINLFLTFY